MSSFMWCIIGMVVAVLVGIWRVKTTAGIARVIFIAGTIIAFLFLLICAISLRSQGM